MARLFFGLIAFVFVSFPAIAEPRAELVMVEQAGCAYCALWNRQIAPIYPKTDVGEAAPLRRIDLHDPSPDGLEFARGFNFTPTFVLVVDGQEVNRLEGYPGEDFFWGLIEQFSVEQGLIDGAEAG